MVEYKTERLDAIFGALADSTRRTMLRQLSQNELSVTELAAPHKMSLAAVSKHLKVLESAHFINRTKDGRSFRCSANLAPLKEVSELLEELGAHWRKQLDVLADFLETEASNQRGEDEKRKQKKR